MDQSTRTARGRLAAIARKAMKERGLLSEFSPAVIAELDAVARAAATATQASESIRDLRGLPWASIDNDDSRDLDQLSVAGLTASGAPAILVAVADVDALVKRGSAIDGHANTNTTSVYTAARIMSARQVRRLPVLDRNKRLVGIVALGDFAVESSEIRPAAEALSQISKPS